MFEKILGRIQLQRSGPLRRLIHGGDVLPKSPVLRMKTSNEFRPQLWPGFVRFMAGHSKWQNIKETKTTNDAARANAFCKLSRMMRVAIKDGKSNDPKNNFKLSHVVEMARRAQMPVNSIENILKEKQVPKENLEQFILEGRGPGGCFLLIEVLTDNVRRTKQKVQSYMKKTGASLMDNCAMHSFDHKGIIEIDNNELSLEKAVEVAIEVGAEDVTQVVDDIDGSSSLQFSCAPLDFYSVRTQLQQRGFNLKTSEMQYYPTKLMELSDDDLTKMAKLNGLFEEDPDIMKCYDNIQ